MVIQNSLEMYTVNFQEKFLSNFIFLYQKIIYINFQNYFLSNMEIFCMKKKLLKNISGSIKILSVDHF